MTRAASNRSVVVDESCPSSTSNHKPNRKKLRAKHGTPPKLSQDFKWHTDPIEDYRMSSYPRGLCLILNNYKFDTLPERSGSEWDVFRFSKMFQDYLGFQIIHNKNLTADKMKQCFLQTSTSCRPKHDALVIILMSHGSESNGIIGVDGVEVDLNDIITYFDNKHCRAMVGKPKIFIIQACRGPKADYGVRELDMPFISQPDSPPPSQQTQSQVFQSLDYPDSPLVKLWVGPPGESIQPTRTDFILCFSCLSGYVSVRNDKNGSWFGRSLFEHLRDYAESKHLIDILNMVSRDIRRKVSDQGHKQALETTCISFDRNLYFNPGLGYVKKKADS